MRYILSIAAALLVLGSAAIAQTRQAPSDLYCRDMQVDRGSTVQYCSAYTMQQCLASRASPNERCYLNPRYDPRFRN